MGNDSWISIHRKLLNWCWYKDINVKTLFLHLLLKANYKDNSWKNINIKRGQLITSIDHLADETGLTVQQTRTALKKLKSTNEITIKTTNKFTVITIEKYDLYQNINNETTNKITNNLTINQQTNNKQITTTNKVNKDNNIYLYFINKYKKEKSLNFYDYMKKNKKMREDEKWELLTHEQQMNLLGR